ncbi:hypothetical protein D918_05911 [Trichuris suis]|nr:hypothetical protein D918_05911 [Trichuris suis]
MADLEAVLADVSYLMAMEKSKTQPASRASKKIILPDPSVRSVMHKYLEKTNEATFQKIFGQKLVTHRRGALACCLVTCFHLADLDQSSIFPLRFMRDRTIWTASFLLIKDFCENVCDVACPQVNFYEEARKFYQKIIKEFEKLELNEERLVKAREIYDRYIMAEMLAHSHHYTKEALVHVQHHLMKGDTPSDLFQLGRLIGRSPYLEMLRYVYNKLIHEERTNW